MIRNCIKKLILVTMHDIINIGVTYFRWSKYCTLFGIGIYSFCFANNKQSVGIMVP